MIAAHFKIRIHIKTGAGRRHKHNIPFCRQFVSRSHSLCHILHTDDRQIGAGVDAISGATVTSRAIARSVNSAVAYVTGADIDSGSTSWGG